LTYVNDAFSRASLSPDVKLFALHVLKSSLVKQNANHALRQPQILLLLLHVVLFVVVLLVV